MVLSIALGRCTEKAVPTASSWATSTLGVLLSHPDLDLLGKDSQELFQD